MTLHAAVTCEEFRERDNQRVPLEARSSLPPEERAVARASGTPSCRLSQSYIARSYRCPDRLFVIFIIKSPDPRLKIRGASVFGIRMRSALESYARARVGAGVDALSQRVAALLPLIPSRKV